MKKVIVSIIITSFLFVTSITNINAFGINAQQEQEHYFDAIPYANIYVDTSNTLGPWDGTYEHPYQHIQDGINAASDGDVIYVSEGTYYEHITINKSIVLRGENKDNTIINACGYENVVRITANYVTISRFTIRNASGSYFGDWATGICVESSYNHINDNKISDIDAIKSNAEAMGVSLDQHPLMNNIITNNTITNIQGYGAFGVFVKGSGEYLDSHNHVISKNIIAEINGDFATGVHIEYASNNMIKENNITNVNPDAMETIGIDVCRWSFNNTVNDNIITNLDTGHFTAIELIYHVHNNTVSNNVVSNIDEDSNEYYVTGIAMTHDVYNNTITNNTIRNIISGNHAVITGIWVYDSKTNYIIGNFIEKCHIGIQLEYGDNSTISKNTIKDTLTSFNVGYMKLTGRGIVIFDSTYSIITYNNFISNAKDPIFVFNHMLNEGESYEYGQIPDSYNEIRDQRDLSNIWSQNYWNRPRLLPKTIEGELWVWSFGEDGESLPLYKVTLYNYDYDPLLSQVLSQSASQQSIPQSQQQTQPNSQPSSQQSSIVTQFKTSPTTNK